MLLVILPSGQDTLKKYAQNRDIAAETRLPIMVKYKQFIMLAHHIFFKRYI